MTLKYLQKKELTAELNADETGNEIGLEDSGA